MIAREIAKKITITIENHVVLYNGEDNLYSVAKDLVPNFESFPFSSRMKIVVELFWTLQEQYVNDMVQDKPKPFLEYVAILHCKFTDREISNKALSFKIYHKDDKCYEKCLSVVDVYSLMKDSMIESIFDEKGLKNYLIYDGQIKEEDNVTIIL